MGVGAGVVFEGFVPDVRICAEIELRAEDGDFVLV